MNVLISIAASGLGCLVFLHYFWPSAYQTILNSFLGVSALALSALVPLLNMIPFPSALQDFVMPTVPTLANQVFYALNIHTAISLIVGGITVKFLRKFTIFLR